VNLGGDDLAAPHVDHQVRPEVHAADERRQPRDVPAPHAIRRDSDEFRRRVGIARRAPRLAMAELPGLAPQPVERGLGSDVLAAHRQDRHDLLGRKIAEFRLVHELQDALLLGRRELVPRRAVRSGATVGANRLLAPALERAHAEPEGLARPGLARACRHGLVDQAQNHVPLLVSVPSPASPHRARIFLSARSAVTSARAASFRRNLRSSSRTRRCSAPWPSWSAAAWGLRARPSPLASIPRAATRAAPRAAGTRRAPRA
jgi:hypothetical protein